MNNNSSLNINDSIKNLYSPNLFSEKVNCPLCITTEENTKKVFQQTTEVTQEKSNKLVNNNDKNYNRLFDLEEENFLLRQQLQETRKTIDEITPALVQASENQQAQKKLIDYTQQLEIAYKKLQMEHNILKIKYKMLGTIYTNLDKNYQETLETNITLLSHSINPSEYQS